MGTIRFPAATMERAQEQEVAEAEAPLKIRTGSGHNPEDRVRETMHLVGAGVQMVAPM
jgi:hypothetical protein